MSIDEADKLSPILTLQQLSQKYPAFGVNTLRWFVYCSVHRASSKGEIRGNGFAECMIRVGRRIYINEMKFLNWLYEQKQMHEHEDYENRSCNVR